MYQLVVELPPGRDGQRRQQYETVRGTLKEAQDRLNTLLLRQGQGPLARDPSVGVLWDEYVVAARLAATSAAEAARARARLPHDFLAMRVSRVSGRAIAALYADLEAAGVSAHQLRQLHIYLSAAFGRAVQWEVLARNPVRSVKPPTIQRREVVPPDPGDVARLLAAAEPDLRPALLILATTGMRRGELCGLRWDDVDLLAGTLRVRRSIAYSKATGVVVKGTKTDRERTVPLGAGALGALAGWYAAVSQPGPATGYVFYRGADRGAVPWRPDYVTHRFMALRNSLGLTLRLHDLRHGVATTLILDGHPLKVVSELLGHTETATTADRYGHVVLAAQQDAVGAMEERLGLGG